MVEPTKAEDLVQFIKVRVIDSVNVDDVASACVS
jgi:hypothetical protein